MSAKTSEYFKYSTRFIPDSRSCDETLFAKTKGQESNMFEVNTAQRSNV
jgi:hypothetical protein